MDTSLTTGLAARRNVPGSPLYCWTAHATHSGDFMGMPVTGKQIEYNGMSVGRFEDGKVVEEWTVMDMFALMQQIGAVPVAS